MFAYLLLVLSAVPAMAQRATLSYIGYPCCLAGDGHGNVFAVSYVLTPANSLPAGTTVARMDAGGSIISTFTFRVGDNDNPLAAALDRQGNLWIAGSTGYPAVRGLIAELDGTGTRVLFSGTFGGNDPKGTTVIHAIAFDALGNAYLGGSTSQSDFPVTPGGFIGKFGGAQQTLGSIFEGPTQYGFVASLAPKATGGYSIAYTALLGGEQLQIPPCPPGGQCDDSPPASSVSAVAVDSGGLVTAAGITNAADFPVTPGAFQTQCQCSNAATSAFVTRLNAPGSGLVWSTLLGSPNLSSGTAMTVGGIALDSGGNAVVDGTTAATTFPVTSGVVQPVFAAGRLGAGNNAFVAKLDTGGSRLLSSTYYGGAVVNQVSAPRLDSQGNIWISEQLLDSTGLVLRKDSLTLGAGLIAELAADGTAVLFSELLPDGVIGQDLVLNADGSLTAAGPARNSGFPPSLATGYALRHPLQGPSGISILGERTRLTMK